MSNSYLNKYRSILPTTQGNQILKLLVSKRDSGEIRNINELKDRLQKLTQEILSERITPTLKLFKAIPGQDTSSSQFNEMIDRIQDDLEAAFAEANNLDEIIAAHHNLINNIALKVIRFGINELESKINLYEFLNRDEHGFNDAIFNTFRESLNHITSRSEDNATLVYIDPRKLTAIDSSEDAEVDFIGERLTLGTSTKNYIAIKSVSWFANNNSIRSELNVSFKNSKLSNIIDNKPNTFWIEPVLLTNISSSGVETELSFNLPSSQDVNFIEIEPASNFPMILAGIDYFDSNNIRKSTAITERTIDSPVRINIEKITATSIILKLRQESYSEVQFSKKAGESNLHRAILNTPVYTVDMDSISAELKEILSSDFILTDVMGLRNFPIEPVKYFEYLVGLDNVRIGFSLFQERGIYVSESKKISKPGQISLKVTETRPTQIVGSTAITLEDFRYLPRSSNEDSKFYHGVPEYWIMAQFFTSDDYLISTDLLPILPIQAQRVYHEHMVFIAQSSDANNPNICQPMFYTAADSSDVLIYRNGTLLTYGTSSTDDWEFIDSADPSLGQYTVEAANSGSPMKRGIKIKTSTDPLDIFTISYTPSLSNTKSIPPTGASLFRVVDLLGDNSVRVTKDNILVFGDTRLSHNIDYANIYFIVIMRRNSAFETYSPALEEYMIITGSRDRDL